MDDKMDVGCFLIIVGIAVAVSVVIAVGFTSQAFRSQAIERGFAEYHPTTGEWQWKESEVTE